MHDPPTASPDALHPYGREVVRSAARLVMIVGLALVIGTVGAFGWATHGIEPSKAVAALSQPRVVLLTADGKPFARRGDYKEGPVDAAALPPHVVQAVLAIEDRRFYRHFGLDLRGLARATVANIEAGSLVQGGSTITQQLAKTYVGSERTFARKLREGLVALWLERKLTKDQILSYYLSSIYFGDGVYGLRAAAKHYFRKEPEKLSLAEAAMLAGVIKAPSKLAPTHHLSEAQARSRVVLAAMVDAGYVSFSACDFHPLGQAAPAWACSRTWRLLRRLDRASDPYRSGTHVWRGPSPDNARREPAGTCRAGCRGHIGPARKARPVWASSARGDAAGRVGRGHGRWPQLRPQPVQSCLAGEATAWVCIQALRLSRRSSRRCEA